MKLTKAQQQVAEELMNQGVIWKLGSHPYIARRDKEGRMKSSPLNLKTFNALIEHNIIEQREDSKWYLKVAP